MKPIRRHFISFFLMATSVGLTACQEKNKDSGKETAEEQSIPVVINPGMRAYVDPVTGEYTTPPPVVDDQAVPAAGIVSQPVAPTPLKKTRLPDGSVLIEMGDQFQANTKTAK